MVVSSMRSKLVLPHIIIAAVLGRLDNNYDAPQHEYTPGVEEVEERDVIRLTRPRKRFSHSDEAVGRYLHNRYTNRYVETHQK